MKKIWPKKLLTAALTSSMMVSMCAVNLFAVIGDQVAKDKVYVGTGSVEADPNSTRCRCRGRPPPPGASDNFRKSRRCGRSPRDGKLFF